MESLNPSISKCKKCLVLLLVYSSNRDWYGVLSHYAAVTTSYIIYRGLCRVSVHVLTCTVAYLKKHCVLLLTMGVAIVQPRLDIHSIKDDWHIAD